MVEILSSIAVSDKKVRFHFEDLKTNLNIGFTLHALILRA